MAVALSVLRSASQHGATGVLLITGPSGIGKSALMSEVCRQASAMKLRVASTACDPVEQVSPGAPVVAMLRAGRDALTTGEQYEQIARMVNEPLLLVERIASHLEGIAATTPLLIAIDDLQWADRTSRFLIRTLVSRLLGLPVVWALVSREDNLGDDLASHDPIRIEHLRLAPLSSADLTAMAEDRLGRLPDARTRRYLAAVGGNPFLATQILDSLARPADHARTDGLAAEFSAAITNRLAVLPDAARDLIHLVAVAGRPLPSRDLVSLLAGVAAPDLAAARAAAIESGLITTAGHSLVFPHELVREAVYAAIADKRARELHRMFAGYYLTTVGEPLVAASHARSAATPGDTASASVLIAAAETLADISIDDAGDLAALAFRTVSPAPPGPAEPGWLELSRRCLAVLCRTQRAGEAIAAADLILARIDDGNLAGEVETEAARALWLGGRIGELVARVERALKRDTLQPAVIARLKAAKALASTRLATGGEASREAAAALELARLTGDRDALILALQAAGEAAKNEARHQTALSNLRELRELVGLSYLSEEITQLQFLDRYDQAQALLDQARADRRSATETIAPALHCAQLWQDFNLGRLDEADAGGRALVDLGLQMGNDVYALDAFLVRISVALLRGDLETAAALLRTADGLRSLDEELRRPGITVMRGWLAAVRGDLRLAVDTLRPVLAGAGVSCSYWPLWPCWTGLFFELGVTAEDGDFAAAALAIAEIAAERNPGVASFEGMALIACGRDKGDLNMMAQAAGVLTRSPRGLLRGFGADRYGRALLAAGNRPAGVAQLDRAWDEYHRVDARVYRADVQRVLRAAGVRRPKWTTADVRQATGWASLTEAERRVAVLIGSGHTNKLAASELGVSINTVGTQLRSAFAKLDIQSRVQLANILNKETAR
jgi:DNA-binding CsgD family transcriptional regulator